MNLLARAGMKLVRLDGWERLSVVVGVVLALMAAVYVLMDETGTFRKHGARKDVPWYGVVIESQRDTVVHIQPGLFDDLIPGSRPSNKAGPGDSDPDSYNNENTKKRGFIFLDEQPAKKGGNVFDQFDSIVDPYEHVRFLDVRLTALLMVLAAVLPYSLLAVVRWIAAGFKHNHS